MMVICDYGCGQEVKYQFKNGKWCCSKNISSCSKVKERKSKSEKEAWKDPVKKKNMIEAQNKLDVRKKRGNAIKVALNRLGVKERRSKSEKESWSKPEILDKVTGPNNGNWNPNRGEVYTPYTELFYDLDYREQIKKEQDYKDPITSKELTTRACLHHIDYNKQNDSRENLIWLSISIHMKTNYNKEKWKNILQEVNEDIIEKYVRLLNI